MRALDVFLDRRDDLRSTAAGDGGLDTCRLLTQALDQAITNLSEPLDTDSTAVVALGSYGREELCLWSDVDVMVLHGGTDPEPFIKTVLYPLWDANLKVGHSVRTVRECVTAARDRIDTLTSLLSARVVVGSTRLFDQLERELAGVVSGRPLAPLLGVMERERRRVDPYPVMAADVKVGRGALRTFQAFGWERSRERLLGRAPRAEDDDEHAARSTLLAVRNGLHAGAGRAFDLYDFDARDQVARWLSSDVATVSRRLCLSLQLGDQLAEERWSALLTTADPMARLGRWLIRRVRHRQSGSSQDGPLAVAARLATSPEGVVIDARAESRMSTPSAVPWSDDERRAFLDLIGSGAQGRVVFSRLERLGWVARDFPEWQAVSALPQLAPFHEHPADAHLWRTTDEMVELIRAGDPLVDGILAELVSTDELLLAAFLHDIGKGRGGDHSDIGADVATAFLERAGFGRATIDTIAAAVRQHLLLPRTALRRDIASPEVIDEVAGEVGDLKTLQVLYLLTIADSKATGRTMWSEWKETLLRQLYMRVAARFGAAPEPATVRGETVAALTEGRFGADEVDRHLAGLPPEYVDATEPEEVAWHLEAIAGLADATSIRVSPGGRRVLVVGRDRTGFLLAVCRAFAAHGVGVQDARLYTREDGVVIDVFEVSDDRSGDPVPSDRWARVEGTLSRIERGGDDAMAAVTARAEAYDTRPRSEVRVRPRPELSSRHTVLEVRAADRVGLLVDIVAALYDEGLDLHLARIDTRAGQAIDVLHVRRAGEPIADDVVLDGLCRRVEARIKG